MTLNKKHFFILALACISVFAFTTADSTPRHDTRESLLLDVVIRALQHDHYAPIDIDDSFSEKVFDTYMERLDYGKRFYLQEDIDKFQKDRTKLDDYILQQDFTFFNSLHKVRAKRIGQIENYYTEILSNPFDFTLNDSLETDVDKIAYTKNKAEMRLRWQNLLKYRVLSNLKTKLTRQEKAQQDNDSVFEIKTFDELEKEARHSLLKEFDNWFVKIGQEDRDDQVAVFVNAITSVFGPHSGYFPPLQKENFNIRMSGKLEGIGAQLRQKDGYIKVVRIVPGSASWKQGELAVDDLIIKVAQGEKEAVDVVDTKMNDVLPLIRGEKGTEVRLTVKKTDGTIKVISIIRDVVVLEESYAKSAILTYGNKNKRVGLIDLRSFYADFNDKQGRRCSKDVKLEVQKLIADGVDGMVIDLRFNGGGSLYDVVDMSGLFIEKGPIVQVKSRQNEAIVLSDRDPSILYDGPLVILVNSYSASASEILAAALQDYGRAIIVGTSPSTFGKGTVQRFMDLDQVVPAAFKDLGQLGSIKVTTQKFFRINGGATQLKGVTPDIILPGISSYNSTGEKEEDFPMPWTEIAPADYEAINLKNLDKIKKKSAERVAASETFSLINESASWYKTLRNQTAVSLNLKEFQAQQDTYDAKSKKFKAINQVIDQLQVTIPNADTASLKSDTIRANSIDTWHKTLKKDPYIQEVVQIFEDWK
ncbi:MAG: carboxy terminal-processing peptidase [Flavobacteriales bacterium]|nr:carboxy terminal-processing peptidase [Flavobacteriales bacterium]